MRELEIKPALDKKLIKLSKRDKPLHKAVMRKIDEILNIEDPEHYKNLAYDMKEYKRVHVGSFILVFKVDDSKKLIIFEDFKHHDDMYRR
jgi:YafQ family addiction module toxin component